jgi:hypothetical protein
MTSKQRDAVELARQLLEALKPEPAANDDEPAIDEEAIIERARRTAERMRRARGQSR